MTIAHEKMQPIQIPDEHSEFLQVDINDSISITMVCCFWDFRRDITGALYPNLGICICKARLT